MSKSKRHLRRRLRLRDRTEHLVRAFGSRFVFGMRPKTPLRVMRRKP